MKKIAAFSRVILRLQIRHLPAVVLLCLFSLPVGGNLFAQETTPQETPSSTTLGVETMPQEPLLCREALVEVLVAGRQAVAVAIHSHEHQGA